MDTKAWLEELIHEKYNLIPTDNAQRVVIEIQDEIEKLQKALKECSNYAKIIKIGLDKDDARFCEADQIERIVKKELEKK